MTYFYYKTNTWGNSNPQVTEETKDFWKHLVEKKNWRIVQLPNGFYQTECKTLDAHGKPTEDWHDVTRRETLEGAEQAVEKSVEHFSKKLEYIKGPKVVKTFK